MGVPMTAIREFFVNKFSLNEWLLSRKLSGSKGHENDSHLLGFVAGKRSVNFNSRKWTVATEFNAAIPHRANRPDQLFAQRPATEERILVGITSYRSRHS